MCVFRSVSGLRPRRMHRAVDISSPGQLVVDNGRPAASTCERVPVTRSPAVDDSEPLERVPAPDVMLGPATRLLWRTHDAIHLELGGQAVIVTRLPQPVIDRIASSAPRRRGARVPASSTDGDSREALVELAARGYLWNRPAGSDDPRLRPPAPRLSGELTALAGRHGDRAAEVLAARSRASVAVHGNPRPGVQVASLLAAAGVGRVWCVTRGSARLSHAAPGGVQPGDEGSELASVTCAAIERAAPEVDTTPLPIDERPDLTILVLDGPHDEERRTALHADGAAHLSVTTGPGGGVVGPLVLPGLTSCLRCADRHRSDRDESWPALAAQLSVPRRHGASCDVASAAILGGTAAAQALAFLDGDEVACIDGTIEFNPPDWRLRRRSWSPHPTCGCGGAERSSVSWAE